MAEPKNKGTNGNHVSEKTVNKNSKLWQLLALAKEVSKDVDAIQDYDKTIEGRKALEQELEAKTEENKKLRGLYEKSIKECSDHKAQAAQDLEDQKAQAQATTRSLLDGFKQQVQDFESNKTEHETMLKDFVEMKAKLEASEALQNAKIDEAEKLKQLLKSAENNSQRLATEMKEMSAECDVHRSRMQTSIAELDACKTKLSAAQGALGEDLWRDYSAEGLKKLGLDLRALSKRLHALAIEYFNDPDGAQDAVSEIQDLKEEFSKVPLSTVTTKSAAQMRCAVAEAVIAKVLMAQVFVPFYLPAHIRDAASSLLDLFGDDEQKRTAYRCQILRSMTDPEELARVQDEIVRKASNEVRSNLHPLVVPYKQAGFFQAVPTFFKEAVVLWASVQRSRHLITAEAPDVNEVQPPSKYDDYDQPSTPKGAKGLRGTVAAVLFPQVSTQEDLIFNGMALWSTQTVQETPANGNSGGEPMKPSPSRRRSVVVPEGPFRNK